MNLILQFLIILWEDYTHICRIITHICNTTLGNTTNLVHTLEDYTHIYMHNIRKILQMSFILWRITHIYTCITLGNTIILVHTLRGLHIYTCIQYNIMNILQIFVHTWEDYTHIYMQHTTQCMCSIQKKMHV